MGNSTSKSAKRQTVGLKYMFQAQEQLREKNYGMARTLALQGIKLLEEAVTFAKEADAGMYKKSLAQAYCEQGDIFTEVGDATQARVSYQKTVQLGYAPAQSKLTTSTRGPVSTSEAKITTALAVSTESKTIAARSPLSTPVSSPVSSVVPVLPFADKLIWPSELPPVFLKNPTVEAKTPDFDRIELRSQKKSKKFPTRLLGATFDRGWRIAGMPLLFRTASSLTDTSQAIAAKLEKLRESTLKSKAIQEELALYIPVSGTYRPQDTNTFGLEKRVQEYLKEGQQKVLLLMGKAESRASCLSLA